MSVFTLSFLPTTYRLSELPIIMEGSDTLIEEKDQIEVQQIPCQSPSTEAYTDSKLDHPPSPKRAKVERRQEKKKRKKHMRSLEAGEGTKQEYKSVFGVDCTCSLALVHDVKLQLPKSRLKMRDIHSLILWSIAKAVQARWVFVKNGPVLEKVVTVIIDGLSESVANEYHELLPALKSVRESTLFLLYSPCQSIIPHHFSHHFRYHFLVFSLLLFHRSAFQTRQTHTLSMFPVLFTTLPQSFNIF